MDDDDDSELDDESPLDEDAEVDEGEADEIQQHGDRGERSGQVAASDEDGAADDEPVDEYGRPEPAANYVVHVYEYKKFKRTIDRPFTPEDAEAFATEFNRTGKSYGRVAVSGKNDAKPKKTLD